MSMNHITIPWYIQIHTIIYCSKYCTKNRIHVLKSMVYVKIPLYMFPTWAKGLGLDADHQIKICYVSTEIRTNSQEIHNIDLPHKVISTISRDTKSCFPFFLVGGLNIIYCCECACLWWVKYLRV